jgi:hypothetical protein
MNIRKPTPEQIDAARRNPAPEPMTWQSKRPEVPMPPLPARAMESLDKPRCRLCRERLRFDTQAGELTQVCRCGTQRVPLQIPQHFQRYASGERLYMELKARAKSQLKRDTRTEAECGRLRHNLGGLAKPR